MNEMKTDVDSLTAQVTAMAQEARAASRLLATLRTETKNKALEAMAHALLASETDIIKENAKDLAAAEKAGVGKSLLDRLALTDERVQAMAKGLQEMARLPDPLEEVLRSWTRPNGLKIRQVRVPLGVIGMIYEARPNVTAEAAGLCLKSGNAVILRGGSEAFHSNKKIVSLISEAALKAGVPAHAIQMLPPQDRRSTRILTQLHGQVDLIIARGSEEMIADVSSHSRVPVLGHGKGVCHVYIDKAADMEKAVNIAFNSKVQRPGVCNAMESLLIHEQMMWDILPKISGKYIKAGVEMRGDDRVVGLIPQAKPASPRDWGTEYHDKIVSMKVVDSLEEAIEHINRYGSGHTDSIVTEDKQASEKFEREVDSSCVMVNASTRLHDGGVFGFGSEIGISTQKLHARGTMGLRELTSTKYIVEGDGQIRE
ncbi:MAG: Gamma-glutamyl phosphate reductase [Elusimicrobia bacterium]|nr:Gamma-glutamyl phosphate reductase [Elusimicrobiota bacterium]